MRCALLSQAHQRMIFSEATAKLKLDRRFISNHFPIGENHFPIGSFFSTKFFMPYQLLVCFRKLYNCGIKEEDTDCDYDR
jgi:hypothetical protein